jgi:hypothetical protein
MEWASLWAGDLTVADAGLLVLCATEHGLEEESRTAELARQVGIPAEVLSPRATA